MTRRATTPATPDQRALVTAFLKAVLVPNGTHYVGQRLLDQRPFYRLLSDIETLDALLGDHDARARLPVDPDRATGQQTNSAIDALTPEQIAGIANALAGYAEDEPADYILGLRRLAAQSPANAEAVSLLMAAAPAADLQAAATQAYQEFLRFVQPLGAEVLTAARGDVVVEKIIRHQLGMDAKFQQDLDRVEELSRKTPRTAAENLELLRESDRLAQILADKRAELTESARRAAVLAGTIDDDDDYPLLDPAYAAAEALRLQAGFAAARAAVPRLGAVAGRAADPVAELGLVSLATIVAAQSAAETALSNMKLSYETIITNQGSKSSAIERLIADNQAKIDRIGALLKQAEGLVEQQTAALAVGNTAGLVVDIGTRIQNIEIAVQDLQAQIDHADTTVFPPLLATAQAARDTQLRETEEKDEADSKQAAEALVTGFADAVKQFVAQRKATDIEAHGLQWLKRKVGWGIDALWGDRYDSVASKKARENWLRRYKKASFMLKIGLRLAVVLSVILAAPIIALQYISYGFTKFFSSLRALWNNEQGSASKFAVRFGILLAVVLALTLLAIPGINVGVAAIFIIPLAIAMWSGLTYLARGAKYSLQPTSLTEVTPGAQDPYKGKQVDGAEVGATPGTRVTIDLDREKLQGLLKVVDQMEQALLDQNRALSTDEFIKLATYRSQIVTGDVHAIKGFLAELNAWNAQAGSTTKPVTIADLESAASKRARAATAASVPAATPTAAAPDLSAAVLRALQAPAPTPAPARAAAARVTAPAAGTGYAGVALPPVSAAGARYVAPPPPPPPPPARTAAGAPATGRAGVAGGGGIAAPLGGAATRSAAPAPRSGPPIAPVPVGGGRSAARAHARPGAGAAASLGASRRGAAVDPSAAFISRL